MRVADLSEEKRNELKERARNRKKGEKIRTTLANYETVVIIEPSYFIENSINYAKTIEKVRKILKINTIMGAEFEVEDIGLKRLAYETRGFNEGYYLVFKYKTSPNFISNLEKYFRENQCFLKFITVRTGE